MYWSLTWACHWDCLLWYPWIIGYHGSCWGSSSTLQVIPLSTREPFEQSESWRSSEAVKQWSSEAYSGCFHKVVVNLLHVQQTSKAQTIPPFAWSWRWSGLQLRWWSVANHQWYNVLLEPFIFAQKLLEGEKYMTVSLVPYALYKIRKGLQGGIG